MWEAASFPGKATQYRQVCRLGITCRGLHMPVQCAFQICVSRPPLPSNILVSKNSKAVGSHKQ